MLDVYFCPRVVRRLRAGTHASILEEFLSRLRLRGHTIRHTSAMHLLQAGVETTVIALRPGHESSETTLQYVEADLEMKRQALDRVAEPPRLLLAASRAGPRRRPMVLPGAYVGGVVHHLENMRRSAGCVAESLGRRTFEESKRPLNWKLVQPLELSGHVPGRLFRIGQVTSRGPEALRIEGSDHGTTPPVLLVRPANVN